MAKYCCGYKTDLEEGFHRVVLKYWRKGTSYEYEEYRIRRALAILHWNEKRDSLEKPHFFRKNIADTFHKFLLTRTKGKNAKNNYYQAEFN